MKRAILLAGGINDQAWRPRYRNDLAAYYRLLVGCGFRKQDIQVFFRDGRSSDLDGDGQLEPTSRASRANVTHELSHLAALQADDLFVLVASNHGSEDGICLWRERFDLALAELQVPLAACAATKLLVLGQCNAGVFAGLNVPNLVVCCACARDESSYAAPGALYDEFLYQLVGALAGAYPDGAAPARPFPPNPTVAEAFLFATEAHRVRVTPDGSENPQLHSNPPDLAARLRL